MVHLTSPYYTDPQTLALAQKVICVVDQDVQAVYPRKRGAKVKIVLKDGRIFEKELYDLKGSPNNPVGWVELEKKFLANAKAIMSEENAKDIVAKLNILDKQESLQGVMDLL